ncbi:MAG: Phage integrase family protein,phage integrase family protein [Microgenomates group bacterium GW2011_GWC1_41_8]|uniref:Phage integrase family protein,phage integrase family protein n=3 Tax=Microgenomates group TaxID=1794810 RepID=A0A0G0TAH6_9BACT|nr:MAG: Phage integrase family protein,phage integrase family protein [Candidatus Roizmanbacteria bacterium GW2011_GWB1_40_7]KKR93868.1 MAG: Phage integrase family protein,phage integrase family protein [Candidatus Roizmanbacteria bacterium GW2011_GWA1_41_13]KKS23466.1 MAG: Phage integrase family protein,phage integrase family protein [Microgenomates group bacterium GW2011_GWC1_41_8]KKS45305.1 MAG: Phage integrase family protein,phage integrase family protein [Candidatus Gottesmanbacteria bacter
MNSQHLNYNSYNFELKFKKYLESNNFSRISIHNYLSDIRTFMNWFSQSLKEEHLLFDLSLFNEKTVKKYIDSLRNANTPATTINRSLSSLRKFSEFLMTDKFIETNPMSDINNIKINLYETIILKSKKHAKPTIAFFLGFSFIAILFLLPGVVASQFSKMTQQNENLLRMNKPISGIFPESAIASTSAGLMTIPILDEHGNLNLTASYPKIIGYNGSLSIQAPELVLSAQQDGNLKLQTDKGSIHFLFNGERPKLPFDSAFYFSGENMQSGTLLYGAVDMVSSSVSLFELASGSPTETKFRVDSEGNVYIRGNIILEGNLIVNPESTIFGTFSGQTATSSASSTQ